MAGARTFRRLQDADRDFERLRTTGQPVIRLPDYSDGTALTAAMLEVAG
jgi:hypothetical protein